MIARWGRRIVAFFAGVSTVATAIAGVLALTLTIWGGSHVIPGPGKSDARPACSDGQDNDHDGRTDFAGGDTNCSSPTDISEKNPACSNGLDDDDDGRIDFAGGDTNCSSPTDRSEKNPACSDGKDNDHDGKIDFGSDDGCAAPDDPAESQ